MKKSLVVLAALTIMVSSCGSASPDSGAVNVGSAATPSVTVDTSATLSTPPTSSAGTDVADDGPATTTGSTEPAQVVAVPIPDGPAVPDVTLELDDGTTFVLADASRPVMLVFWAEW